MEVTRDFTATVFVVNGGRVLLHLHKKLNTWLPLGGHVDDGELPEVAAKRECLEEGGLEVEIVSWRKRKGMGDVRELEVPRHLLLEDIEEGHQHIDFIYYGRSETDTLVPGEGESETYRWFSEEELRGLDAGDDVRVLGQEAIRCLD